MAGYRNDLERFIYEKCYEPIWESVELYLSKHIAQLEFPYSNIKYPDHAMLQDILLEYTDHIFTEEDSLSFDAIISCTIYLTEKSYYNERTCETTAWFRVSCKAVLKEKIEAFSISQITPYEALDKSTRNNMATANMVPILAREQMDQEATCFLTKYFPLALEEPMPLPISDIAEKMGLNVIEGYCLSDDFSIFGEIFYTSTNAELYDVFLLNKLKMEVQRGTILVDAKTFWERNVGCVNNTIAHEVYHWYKHRVYASIKHILNGSRYTACRCPVDGAKTEDGVLWSDSDWMEWQANNMAPRILMPKDPFIRKVQELYQAYDYDNTPLHIAVLTAIADELAKFYNVSRQSALIRMKETGFPEADLVLNDKEQSQRQIDIHDAFFLYCTNPIFRKLLDSARFIYADGYYVLNAPDYITQDEQGVIRLTQYAHEHLAQCTLRFTRQTITPNENESFFSHELAHRDNQARKTSQYDEEDNQDIVTISEALVKTNMDFEQLESIHRLHSGTKTPWEFMKDILDVKQIGIDEFCYNTLLGKEVFDKIKRGHKSVPSIETIVAFACGCNIDMETTEQLMKLASHSFNDCQEHRAYRYCISGLYGKNIEFRNKFLTDRGIKPLGTKTRE